MNKAPSLIILYAVLMHLTWAFSLAFDPSGIGATAVASVNHVFPYPYLIDVLFFVALLAFAGLFAKRARLAALAMVPQQFVLCVSAGGALHTILIGAYADGIQRPTGFLVNDQLPAILAALLHTLAIWRVARGWSWIS